MKTKNCHKDNISIHAGEDVNVNSSKCPLAKTGCMPRGMSDYRSIIDFDHPAAAISFRVLNDTMMGGASGCEIKYMSDEALTRFFGRVSYDRGGGFASVRSPPLPEGILDGTHGLTLLTSSMDGLLYKLTLKTRAGIGVSAALWHRDFFPSADRGGLWRVTKLPYDTFTPISKHQPCSPGGSLQPALIEEVGFMMSRFKQDGTANAHCEEDKFSMNIKSIRAYFTSLRPIQNTVLRDASPQRSPLLAECMASLTTRPSTDQEDVEYL